MKILLTGYNGFVGTHFNKICPCEALADAKGQVFLNDYLRLQNCIDRIKPEAVIHLAAQSNVPLSFADAQSTYEVNFFGTFNLLKALEVNHFNGKFLFVGSGDSYGSSNQTPLIESMPLKPKNPYAVSKAAAESLCYQWSQTSRIQIIMTRSFNHIGPGQSDNFVIPNFAKQIARIKHGKQSSIVNVGDIDVTRDFTDVRDVINAYLLLLKLGTNGEIYNVCSGKGQLLRDALLHLAKLANVEIDIYQDKEKFRTNEQKKIIASNEKICKTTGWAPKISFEKSLQDIFEYEEEKLK